MELETLSLRVGNGIARVGMTRGDALNTMTEPFWREMVDVFDAIVADPSVRVVVISSTGRHFTAGLDLKWAATQLQGGKGDIGRQRAELREKVTHMQRTFSVIDECRVPVIAVVQGGCIGGGVDLVTACDIRIGAADCFFSIQEINLGIVADVGTLQRIPYLLPQGLVRELAYTGRRFPAEEAHRYGFLNRVEASHEAALAAADSLAAEIAAKSPLAIMGTKTVLNRGRDQSIAEGLDYVALWNAAMLPGADMTEAVTAALEKRAPRFADLA
jgi:enoyl-CoA hydratase